eukprot:scaffold23891_cov18-Prasinocladus_malaysianus.AAC.1
MYIRSDITLALSRRPNVCSSRHTVLGRLQQFQEFAVCDISTCVNLATLYNSSRRMASMHLQHKRSDQSCHLEAFAIAALSII